MLLPRIRMLEMNTKALNKKLLVLFAVKMSKLNV